MEIPQSVRQAARETAEKLPKNASEIFQNCYLDTLANTTTLLDDGTTFLITGDIPAMWLRDSSAQVMHYLPLVPKDREVSRIIGGLVRRQAMYVNLDPYANAFNREPDDSGWKDDLTERNPWDWERKYEVDSLCYPILLAYRYWKAGGETQVFEESFFGALRKTLAVWKTEQHHDERSPYRFQRRNCRETSTLANGGLGTPVAYTGMTWSGFRPSDDRCVYGYNIPANMFAAVVLGYVEEMAEQIYRDASLREDAAKLRSEIDRGIAAFGTAEQEGFGKIYAFETDGMGNRLLADDANVPNLLGIPYFGYRGADDEIYRNTRRFVLSGSNPYYYEGKFARGLGSSHTPKRNVWHIGLIMQALTSQDPRETEELVRMILRTDAGCGCMHESFHPDNPHDFTRKWFAWADSLFAELMLRLADTPENGGA